MSNTGIFGKHPAFGDFIGAGLSKPMQVKLEEWLGAVLPRVRDNLGGVWQPFYDIALPLRFWIGEGALPRDVLGPVAGVMVFSHDKVGRRFPLVALNEAGNMPPPTVDPDQRWYDALQALMLEHDTPETAGDLAQMLTLPPGFEPAPSQGGEASFWAVHTAGALTEMLSNVAATDHRRAARPRSYWWCAGDRSRTATFHTLEGWPDADVFQWLLAGNPADEEPEPEEPAAPLPETDAFLTAVAVDAATDMDRGNDPWASDGAPKVPAALYAPVPEPEELPEDGPQSPFSLREAKAAEPDPAPEPEDADDIEDEDEPESDIVGEEDEDTAEMMPDEAEPEDEDVSDEAPDEEALEPPEDDTAQSEDDETPQEPSDDETQDDETQDAQAKPARDAFADEAE